jgi:hypothetical protein
MSTKTKQKESTMSIQNRQFVQRIQGLPSVANTNITSNNYSYLSEAPGGSGGGGSGGTGGENESGRDAITKVMDNFCWDICPPTNCGWECGDYNNDGVVNVDDVLWVLEHWDDFNNPVPAGEPESAGGKPSFASIQNRMPGKPSIGMPESTQRPTDNQLTEAMMVLNEKNGDEDGKLTLPVNTDPEHPSWNPNSEEDPNWTPAQKRRHRYAKKLQDIPLSYPTSPRPVTMPDWYKSP